jgi:hypothetical protein
VLLLALFALSGEARVKPWDYRERRTDLEGRLFRAGDTPLLLPAADARWERAWRPSGEEPARFRPRAFRGAGRIHEWAGRTHEGAGRIYEGAGGARGPVRHDPAERLSSPDRQAQRVFRLPSRFFRPEDWETIVLYTHRAIASADRLRARVRHDLDPQRVREPLSMADLNRFQFRSTHSREPGLPAVEAGLAEDAGAGEGASPR